MNSMLLFTRITMVSLFCSSLGPGKRSIFVWFSGYLFDGMLSWIEVFVRLLYGTSTLLEVRDLDFLLGTWGKLKEGDIPRSLLTGGHLTHSRPLNFLIGTIFANGFGDTCSCNRTNDLLLNDVYFSLFVSGYS